jgi:amino acid permease
MADSLNVILEGIPALHGSKWIHPTTLKLLLVGGMTPLTWSNNLSWLSYTSLLGILSVLNLAGIITFDGFYRTSSPGSLLDPMPTILYPETAKGWMVLPIMQGIFMSGFAGHAVFPNLIADMEDRSRFPLVISVAYLFVGILSIFVSVVGYRMFGATTMKEITMNLSNPTLMYPAALQQFTIGLMAINAMTKYPLTVGGVNLNLESLLVSLRWWDNGSMSSRIALRSLVAACVATTSILFPSIHKVLAILGSFFSFLVCVIIPCICHLKLFELSSSERLRIRIVVIFASILATIGTVWTFLPADVTGVE